MGRDREHLTELEVERLIKVAKRNRHGPRDATMVLIGFRHGLRVSELCGLRWSSVEFETGTVHVRRAKGGEAATHPLLGDELRALRELKRQSTSPFVFASERGGPFTPSGFAKLLARAGEEAGMFIDCSLDVQRPFSQMHSRRDRNAVVDELAGIRQSRAPPQLWRGPQVLHRELPIWSRQLLKIEQCFWPTGTASERPKWWICAGSRSTSKPHPYLRWE
jgi:hypothetical protein